MMTEKQKLHDKRQKELAKIIGSRSWLNNRRNGLRRRAQLSQLPFELNTDSCAILYAGIHSPCPYCEKTMTYGGGQDNQPTVDRIIPANGYILSNCIIVCGKCNRKKSDLSAKQILNMADAIRKVSK